MAGQTIIEKIIEVHTEDEVRPGAVVWMDVDYRSARDFGGANVVKNLERFYPDGPVVDPTQTYFTFDTNAPASLIGYADNQMICRRFAAEHDIRVFDVDSGIGTHVAIEHGLVRPGQTSVGTDSHFNIMGAIGAFGQGMGDQDIAYAFKAGRVWFEVPETIRIRLEGELKYPVTAKDVILKIVGTLGAGGALGKAVEVVGEAACALPLAGRITLASMATEMGAISIFLVPSDDVLEYCRQRSGGAAIERIEPDGDARYVREIEIDLTGMEPQVACPPKPDKVVSVSEVAGREIHSVFLGSCTNGRYEDMETAAEILRGGRIAAGVMVKVVPATKEVFGEMLRAGLIEDFFAAGAIVSSPGCAGCAAGQIGMTGRGEVQLSTGNRNFAGKQGRGDTYLTSPVVAAASALEGRIVVP